ncbi:TPA: GNAT family N-acetyltransferase [Vibrio fluvialis]|uniref:GNAT family N-acetyltransferase n=1 Tax=Vibrio fluvialis TaxID=676 RepID=UPI000B21AD1D|nr:GNAT family N-acetyltransferase [Vibrio fluvialis]MCE7598124.1 GNAT family N-acetyltransferase [Vibrio fluvialis]MCG6348359.1 GNAT family N-acetyltransferase [Vibrio fluvialis]MCG6384785.1 GNAT family N-acetyltransferase [Vibrio fluvialis]
MLMHKDNQSETTKNSGLLFVTPELSEFEQVFATVKQGIFDLVDEVFGWDDEFQRQRLRTDYQWAWFHWIVHRGERVGLICFKPYDNAYHVHLLIIFPHYQNQAIGQSVMQQLTAMGQEEQRSAITLSSFAANHAAIRFYQRLGYRITEQEADFVSMALRLDER